MLTGAIGAGLVAAAVPGAMTANVPPAVAAPAGPSASGSASASASASASPAGGGGTLPAAAPGGAAAGAAQAPAPAAPAGGAMADPLADPAPVSATATPAAADASATGAASGAAAPASGPADAPPQAATVTAASPPAGRHHRRPPNADDPFAGFNRVSYAISQPIDRFLFRPAAMVYAHVVPKLLRDGARNFLDNLFMSQVLANDILQVRPKRALHTAVRFLVNTTLGVGGIFDIARRKPFHLPAHPNSLGDTFGYYGIRPGPYFYLPVLGPTTLRDLAGSVGDAFTQPLVLNSVTSKEVYQGRHHRHVRETSAYQVTTYGIAAFVVGGLDKRARADGELRAFKSDSVDPYAALRSAFLQNRAGEIAALKAPGDGIPGANAEATIPAFDDPLDDPAAGAAPAGGGRAPAPDPAPAVTPAPGAP